MIGTSQAQGLSSSCTLERCQKWGSYPRSTQEVYPNLGLSCPPLESV